MKPWPVFFFLSWQCAVYLWSACFHTYLQDVQYLHTFLLLKLVLPHTIWLTERFPTLFCFVFCYWRSCEECIQSSSHTFSHLLSITPTQCFYNRELRFYSSEANQNPSWDSTTLLDELIEHIWTVISYSWLAKEYSILLFEFHTLIKLETLESQQLANNIFQVKSSYDNIVLTQVMTNICKYSITAGQLLTVAVWMKLTVVLIFSLILPQWLSIHTHHYAFFLCVFYCMIVWLLWFLAYRWTSFNLLLTLLLTC